MTSADRGDDSPAPRPRRAAARPGIALGNWRWTVRQRMADVREVLIRESEHPDEAWLAARGTAALRERNALLARIGELGPQVLESPDLDQVRPACCACSPTSTTTSSGCTTSPTTTWRWSSAAPSTSRRTSS